MSEDDLKDAIIDVLRDYAYEFNDANGEWFGVPRELDARFADDIIALMRKQIKEENDFIDKELG